MDRDVGADVPRRHRVCLYEWGDGFANVYMDGWRMSHSRNQLKPCCWQVIDERGATLCRRCTPSDTIAVTNLIIETLAGRQDYKNAMRDASGVTPT